MLFRNLINVHSENLIKPINTLCGQNAELLNVKLDGTFNDNYNKKRFIL
jgi:hypothetical protein